MNTELNSNVLDSLVLMYFNNANEALSNPEQRASLVNLALDQIAGKKAYKDSKKGYKDLSDHDIHESAGIDRQRDKASADYSRKDFDGASKKDFINLVSLVEHDSYKGEGKHIKYKLYAVDDPETKLHPDEISRSQVEETEASTPTDYVSPTTTTDVSSLSGEAEYSEEAENNNRERSTPTKLNRWKCKNLLLYLICIANLFIGLTILVYLSTSQVTQLNDINSRLQSVTDFIAADSGPPFCPTMEDTPKHSGSRADKTLSHLFHEEYCRLHSEHFDPHASTALTVYSPSHMIRDKTSKLYMQEDKGTCSDSSTAMEYFESQNYCEAGDEWVWILENDNKTTALTSELAPMSLSGSSSAIICTMEHFDYCEASDEWLWVHDNGNLTKVLPHTADFDSLFSSSILDSMSLNGSCHNENWKMTIEDTCATQNASEQTIACDILPPQTHSKLLPFSVNEIQNHSTPVKDWFRKSMSQPFEFQHSYVTHVHLTYYIMQGETSVDLNISYMYLLLLCSDLIQHYLVHCALIFLLSLLAFLIRLSVTLYRTKVLLQIPQVVWHSPTGCNNPIGSRQTEHCKTPLAKSNRNHLSWKALICMMLIFTFFPCCGVEINDTEYALSPTLNISEAAGSRIIAQKPELAHAASNNMSTFPDIISYECQTSNNNHGLMLTQTVSKYAFEFCKALIFLIVVMVAAYFKKDVVISKLYDLFYHLQSWSIFYHTIYETSIDVESSNETLILNQPYASDADHHRRLDQMPACFHQHPPRPLRLAVQTCESQNLIQQSCSPVQVASIVGSEGDTFSLTDCHSPIEKDTDSSAELLASDIHLSTPNIINPKVETKNYGVESDDQHSAQPYCQISASAPKRCTVNCKFKSTTGSAERCGTCTHSKSLRQTKEKFKHCEAYGRRLEDVSHLPVTTTEYRTEHTPISNLSTMSQMTVVSEYLHGQSVAFVSIDVHNYVTHIQWLLWYTLSTEAAKITLSEDLIRILHTCISEGHVNSIHCQMGIKQLSSVTNPVNIDRKSLTHMTNFDCLFMLGEIRITEFTLSTYRDQRTGNATLPLLPPQQDAIKAQLVREAARLSIEIIEVAVQFNPNGPSALSPVHSANFKNRQWTLSPILHTPNEDSGKGECHVLGSYPVIEPQDEAVIVNILPGISPFESASSNTKKPPPQPAQTSKVKCEAESKKNFTTKQECPKSAKLSSNTLVMPQESPQLSVENFVSKQETQSPSTTKLCVTPQESPRPNAVVTATPIVLSNIPSLSSEQQQLLHVCLSTIFNKIPPLIPIQILQLHSDSHTGIATAMVCVVTEGMLQIPSLTTLQLHNAITQGVYPQCSSQSEILCCIRGATGSQMHIIFNALVSKEVTLSACNLSNPNGTSALSPVYSADFKNRQWTLSSIPHTPYEDSGKGECHRSYTVIEPQNDTAIVNISPGISPFESASSNTKKPPPLQAQTSTIKREEESAKNFTTKEESPSTAKLSSNTLMLPQESPQPNAVVTTTPKVLSNIPLSSTEQQLDVRLSTMENVFNKTPPLIPIQVVQLHSDSHTGIATARVCVVTESMLQIPSPTTLQLHNAITQGVYPQCSSQSEILCCLIGNLTATGSPIVIIFNSLVFKEITLLDCNLSNPKGPNVLSPIYSVNYKYRQWILSPIPHTLYEDIGKGECHGSYPVIEPQDEAVIVNILPGISPFESASSNTKKPPPLQAQTSKVKCEEESEKNFTTKQECPKSAKLSSNTLVMPQESPQPNAVVTTTPKVLSNIPLSSTEQQLDVRLSTMENVFNKTPPLIPIRVVQLHSDSHTGIATARVCVVTESMLQIPSPTTLQLHNAITQGVYPQYSSQSEIVCCIIGNLTATGSQILNSLISEVIKLFACNLSTCILSFPPHKKEQVIVGVIDTIAVELQIYNGRIIIHLYETCKRDQVLLAASTTTNISAHHHLSLQPVNCIPCGKEIVKDDELHPLVGHVDSLNLQKENLKIDEHLTPANKRAMEQSHKSRYFNANTKDMPNEKGQHKPPPTPAVKKKDLPSSSPSDFTSVISSTCYQLNTKDAVSSLAECLSEPNSSKSVLVHSNCDTALLVDSRAINRRDSDDTDEGRGGTKLDSNGKGGGAGYLGDKDSEGSGDVNLYSTHRKRKKKKKLSTKQLLSWCSYTDHPISLVRGGNDKPQKETNPVPSTSVYIVAGTSIHIRNRPCSLVQRCREQVHQLSINRRCILQLLHQYYQSHVRRAHYSQEGVSSADDSHNSPILVNMHAPIEESSHQHISATVHGNVLLRPPSQVLQVSHPFSSEVIEEILSMLPIAPLTHLGPSMPPFCASDSGLGVSPSISHGRRSRLLHQNDVHPLGSALTIPTRQRERLESNEPNWLNAEGNVELNNYLNTVSQHFRFYATISAY